jgi:hypothetical protein
MRETQIKHERKEGLNDELVYTYNILFEIIDTHINSYVVMTIKGWMRLFIKLQLLVVNSLPFVNTIHIYHHFVYDEPTTPPICAVVFVSLLRLQLMADCSYHITYQYVHQLSTW